MLDPARCIVAFLAAPLRDALQAGRAPDGARPVLDGLGLGAWIDDGTAPVTSFYGADATTRADLVARWHAITSSDAPCTHALAVLAAATLHETGASTVETSLAALPPDVANALRHVMAVVGWDVADASSLIFSSRMTAAVACRGGLLACATGDVATAAASLDAYALRLAATGMVPPEATETAETDAPPAAHAHAAPATPLGALVAMLDAAAGRQPSTAAEVLESAGARGFYDEGDRLPYAEGAPLFGAYRWARHPSRVRRATLADLPRLLELEHLCWDHTRSDETVLRRRIDTYPAGQFVIEIDGAVAGCVYSQRVVTTDALTTVTAYDVHTLHRADGGLVQLLAINIDPRWQDQRLGDRLLEFLLRLATVTEGVEGVVGVTLCKRFDGASQDDFDTYVQRDGTGQDPVLAFHQAHGASIVRAVPGYRPDDAVNRTNGVLVAYDLVDRLARIRAACPSGSAPLAGASERDLARWVGQRVKALLGNDSAAYAAERPLMEMGVDSAGLLALQRDLEGALGRALPGAFFFEHNTVARIAAALGIRDVAPAPAPMVTAPARTAAPMDVRAGDIAIVGVACRLPGGVASPDALWKALDEGTNLIGSYPASRGRWASPSRYPGIDRGGFVTDIEAFDAAFFRISPAEARLMDPQQRLVLELAWQSLEDAGVVPASLAGRDVGVFVGASNADYSRLLQEQGEDAEAHLGVASSLAVIANRVSYFFDLGGPSLLLDTACSSSLVALHTAVQSLRRGECSSALVAGVNVICHPDLSVAYHKAGMLSPDGLCKVFDARADGYVRAEGAVAMYLKPLADALADGDPVQGVVRGTAINHGGLASGLTVPNPRKQRDLLLAAWRDADIDASAIGYLEAHGTGTSLGDPIEVEAIRGARAAAGLAGSTAPCGIGSLKSQLGHLESAAGLAGVLKVVLTLRHDHVPATLHFNHLNPKIQLTDGLRVQSPAAPWPDGPRIAGVSSFGSGGANAHAVVAAYPETMAAEPSEGPHLFVLSAHDPERLRVAVARAVDWLEGDGRHAPFAAAIRTWQCGRTALPHRIALRVERREQLVERLRAWLAGATQVDDLWSGDTSGAIDGLDMWRTPAAQALIAHAAREGDLTQLATLWARGVPVDWSTLHASRQRIAGLPSYPFARDRHWIDAASDGLVSAAGLHPMLHVNVSGLSGAAYTSSFRGSEPFLADHRVRIGDRVDPVLPAVAYVEMMCAAFERATPVAERGSGIALTHVAWMAPLIVRSPAQVHVVLSVDDAGSVRCDIASGDEARVPHGVGHLAWASDDTPEAVDLASLRARLDDASDAGSLYARLEELGLIYGPAHRALARLRQGRDEVLAELVLPPSLLATAGAYRLHPSLADAALQACLGLQGGSDAEPRLPFSVEHAWIRCDGSRLPSVAWIRRAGEGDERIDIDLCAEDGTVVAAWRGFSTRRIVATAAPRVQIGASTWQAIVDEAPALPWQRRVRLTLGTRAWPSATRLAVEPTDVVAVVTACLAHIQASFATRDAEPCLFQIGIDEGSALGDGLAAMFRTIAREEPRWHGQVLVAPASVDGDAFSAWADAMAARPGLKLVRWKTHGLGETPAWNFMPGVPDGVPYREHGVYLVTGGLGGIGSLVATDILSRAAHARVVVGGRGALEGERAVRFERLRRRFGERIDYRSMDLADDTNVAAAIAGIVASHGALHGVFHAAGTTRDAFVRGKALDDVAAVLAPKVAGTLSLDAATVRLALDTFVCFSSTTAALGQVGQADYAAANGFMDGFARLRNMRVAAGERHGRTLSIAWPLWKDGGMRMDDVARREWQKATGMLPLGTDDGLRALRAVLLSGIEHGIVMSGRVDALQRTLDATRKAAPATLPRDAQMIAAPASAGDDLRAAVETWLRGELARVLKTPADRVQASAAFETFGMDSILAMALTGALEKTTGPLPKTLLFEYRNLSELAGYLMTSHADSLTARFAVTPAQRAVASVAARTLPAPTAKLPALARRGQARGAEPIAIVGISGRYPGAPDLATFWTNLRDGVDSIVEVPADRWDWRQYYSDDRTAAGRHYSRWGGFIEGVDEFDPQFFSIAPREARFIDPQERMFLQHAWMAVEDAGYTRATLRGGDEEAGRVGVYVGVMYSEYQLFGVRAQPESLRMGFAGNVASIANRVSYVLDLHGPSMTVDTMCSSSLTAIHLACQDLRSGATRMAIAGGVNLTVHPHKYLMLSAGQFISSDGHCQSFGEGGDGYIPGEGVGAVVLKRLADAERDGDVIHGVIRGSALNHGGRTNGYTVPNPQAQAAAIERALSEAGVDVRRIGYVEAHGTGTRLGDPIEIAALSRAFGPAAEKGGCLIGSAKSNIGHCEAAAGIAGLTKVLLQMRHGQVVPSLHSARLNPHIDFASSPFTVNQTLRAWEAPVVEGRRAPRMAGLSSFGAGGSNAHMVVEAYEATAMALPDGPVVLVLSGRTAEALRGRVADLLTYLEDRPAPLASVAWTLQIGREAMNERLACVAADVPGAIGQLRAYLEGEESEGLFAGQAQQHRDAVAWFAEDAELREAVARWASAGRLERVAQAWVRGVEIPWSALHGGRTLPKTSLPTYPFARERYWLDLPKADIAPGASRLHPLLHENVSDLRGQRFRSRFGEAIGAWDVLEMARAAAVRALGVDDATPLGLYDVAWFDTPRHDDVLDVQVWQDDDGMLGFAVTRDDADETLLAEGGVDIAATMPSADASLESLRQQLPLFEADHHEGADDYLLLANGEWSGIASVLDRVASPTSLAAMLCGSAWPQQAWLRIRRQTGSVRVDMYAGDGTYCARLDDVRIDAPMARVDAQDEAEKAKTIEQPWCAGPAWVRTIGGARADDAITAREASVIAKPRIALDALDASGSGFGGWIASRPRIALPATVHGDDTVATSEVRVDDVAKGVARLGISAAGGMISAAVHDAVLAALAHVATRTDLRVLLVALDAESGAFETMGFARDVAAQLSALPCAAVGLCRGDAIGASWWLALSCDALVVSSGGHYGLDEGSWSLAGAVRRRTGVVDVAVRPGAAWQAAGWSGRVVPAAQVDEEALSLARALAEKPADALRLLKAHLWRGEMDVPFEVSAAVADAPALVRVDAREVSAVRRQLDEAIARGASSVVLWSEVAPFEDGVEANAIASLCAWLAEAPVPVVAALGGDAQGAAWLGLLGCDEVVHAAEGWYGAQGVLDAAPLSGWAGVCLPLHLGREGRRALLDGESRQGRAWRGAQVANAGDVLSRAQALARRWAGQPAAVLSAWRQARRVPSVVWESTSEALPTAGPVVLSSTAVKATAQADGVLLIELCDRDARNMFSEALVRGVEEAFAHAASQPYRAVVVTGYDTYFASGGTRESLLAIQSGQARFTDFTIFRLPMSCPVPVIAAMQGHGIGAGWSLGLFADLGFYAEEARYVSPYMDYGFTPGAGATLMAPARLGQALGRESLLSAREYTGRALGERGVGEAVLPRAEVLPAALALASRMARHPRHRLVGLKALWNVGLAERVDETFARELDMHDKTFVGDAATLARIEGRFGSGSATTPVVAPKSTPSRAAASATGRETPALDVKTTLRRLLAQELQMPEDDIDEQAQFVDLGLDSIVGVTWVRRINETYGLAIEATRVYSHPTLALMARHVGEQVKSMAPVEAVDVAAPANAPTTFADAPRRPSIRRRRPHATAATRRTAEPEAIAVIGMAGRFPQANDLDAFWRNLAEGRDCIDEVPASRWSVDRYYRAGAAEPGHTNSRWMGALDGHDQFDPLFFSISPKEAEHMDPQQRLFLQTCWHAFEDAAYGPRSLAGTRCGVFVGVTNTDYQQLSAEQRRTAQGFTGNATSILAGRVAYLLDLQGPCLSIDTACSSSLVAMSHACESLVNGTADMALAGGVYVMVGPDMHIKTAQAGMLSTDGRCFAFDARANGFVPGEGVGAVVLKRLADAERDGDRIHGVIRGWGVNQDGRTNGITAPNPVAQQRLQRGVYERFAIDPAQIQLIEAHGTGTKLGDPIEVQALKDSFAAYTRREGYCALGSVKSNIGHTLTAAGVAGFLKLLLALRHRQLPPTAQFERLNEHIALEGSPFFVNAQLTPWTVGEGERRRAALNSFGFSGTNAHLVVEEYDAPVVASPKGEALCVLSARTPEALRTLATALAERLERDGSDWLDLAYTLQVGREAMEERLAFVAGDAATAAARLRGWLAGERHGVHVGQAGRQREAVAMFAGDEDLRRTADGWLREGRLEKLGEWWVRGLDHDWAQLHRERTPRRVDVPLYPFAKERYWHDAPEEESATLPSTQAHAHLHPLIHRNVSLIGMHAYRSRFDGGESFLADHRVRIGDSGVQRVLPGVASLEMARAAICLASGAALEQPVALSQLVWLAPFVVAAPRDAVVDVTMAEGGMLDIAIEDEEGVSLCRVSGQVVQALPPARLDLAHVAGGMAEHVDASTLYGALTAMGLHYGPAHRAVTEVQRGDRQALATLHLPADLSLDERCLLHPSLLDGAVQVVAALMLADGPLPTQPPVPSALASVRVHAACGETTHVWMRAARGHAPEHGQWVVDIDLCDDDGLVSVELRGFVLRLLGAERADASRGVGESATPVPDATPEAVDDLMFYRQLIDAVANRDMSVDEALDLG